VRTLLLALAVSLLLAHVLLEDRFSLLRSSLGSLSRVGSTTGSSFRLVAGSFSSAGGRLDPLEPLLFRLAV
jgi:hypothetical protein